MKNNINEIEQLARNLMDHYGLTDWDFSFCNGIQMKGKTNLEQKRIALSRIHAQYEQDMTAIQDTILHEIAHAIDYTNRGKSNHDHHWKHIAKSIGCIPSSKGRGNSSFQFKRNQLTKWIGFCPHCDKKYYRNQRRKVSCGACCKQYNNGRFSRDYLLKYRPNPDFIEL